jgi:hypothetical protein
MLNLPAAFAIELKGEPTDIDRILVAGELFHTGRYYFGGILALTDAAGHVTFSRDSIVGAFEENQRLFPMDFRVPIEECDSTVWFVLPGKDEFAVARRNALVSSMASTATKEMWRSAGNERIKPVRMPVTLSNPKANEVINLTLPALRQRP